jgi:hypothetical protein
VVLAVLVVLTVHVLLAVHVSRRSRKMNVEGKKGKSAENQRPTLAAPIKRTLHPKDGTNSPVSISQEGACFEEEI